MMRRILIFFALLLLTTGCARLGRPTLHAKWMEQIPEPNGRIESRFWSQARPLDVRLKRGDETRHVRLQAIHDGRAITFLAQWYDTTATFRDRAWTINGEREQLDLIPRRLWVWNPESEAYRLVENEVDWLAFMWPLDERAAGPAMESPHRFCMLDGQSALYDIWQWLAGWSDLSGYALDRRLELRGIAPGESASTDGPIYDARNGPGRVALRWIDDTGTPGTVPTRRPPRFRSQTMPGATAGRAQGSAADVKAVGVFNPANGYDSYWFVEVYRLLVTADREEDYRLGAGRHRFALALGDNGAPGAHFASGPIELVIEPVP